MSVMKDEITSRKNSLTREYNDQISRWNAVESHVEELTEFETLLEEIFDRVTFSSDERNRGKGCGWYHCTFWHPSDKPNCWGTCESLLHFSIIVGFDTGFYVRGFSADGHSLFNGLKFQKTKMYLAEKNDKYQKFVKELTFISKIINEQKKLSKSSWPTYNYYDYNHKNNALFLKNNDSTIEELRTKVEKFLKINNMCKERKTKKVTNE